MHVGYQSYEVLSPFVAVLFQRGEAGLVSICEHAWLILDRDDVIQLIARVRSKFLFALEKRREENGLSLL
jgi:hypothetical protein